MSGFQANLLRIARSTREDDHGKDGESRLGLERIRRFGLGMPALAGFFDLMARGGRRGVTALRRGEQSCCRRTEVR